uniref:PDZK1-interacting protein 1 n=1 Tax=Oryctolagus cuniculus TaxID=9986 RepID=A0A5F9DEX0_RABIT
LMVAERASFLCRAELPPAQPGVGRLQPWMQGLIAVAVFLVLVAIAFAVNHFWCQEESVTGPMLGQRGRSKGTVLGVGGQCWKEGRATSRFLAGECSRGTNTENRSAGGCSVHCGTS